MKIGIIGCGHMGSAIAEALVSRGNAVRASNPAKPRLKLSAAEKKLFHWTIDNREAVDKVDTIIVAVKPGSVSAVLAEIRPRLKKPQLLLSIAAGIPLKKLIAWSGHKKIVRVMPNLPAQVGSGMSVWKASVAITNGDKKNVRVLLDSFGKNLEVHDENLIGAATAVSGGGPAYVAAFLESMASVCEKTGFSSAAARTLALQTLRGSLDYIEKTGVAFGALKKAVQTKGGTTEAAFKVLKSKKWQAVFEKALRAASKRSRQLGS